MSAGLPALPGADADGDEEEEELDEDEEEELRAHAEALEASAADAFTKRLGKRNSAEAKWLQLSRSSGTTSDRVAALTLLVQVSADPGSASACRMRAAASAAERKGG